MLSHTSFAVELPEPLSFDDAIRYANKSNHYSINQRKFQLEAAQASVLEVESQNELSIAINGYVRQVGVSELGDASKTDDSKISLSVKKNLYDFGLLEHQIKAAHLGVKIEQLSLNIETEHYVLDVIASYFDVLKADNEFLMNNESMSIAYVGFNRSEQKAALGESSDLDILKTQAQYELSRQKRFLSEAKQRLTRQKLAELLSASDSPPDQLETPEFNNKRILINDVDKIIALALKNSKNIQRQKLKIERAIALLKIAQQQSNTNISAEFEASDYQRKSAFRDDWRVSLNFNVPLNSGEGFNANISKAQANIQVERSLLLQLRSSMRLSILTLWQTVKQKKIELEGAIIKQDYRDLYLEQSRADYELEYKSDLGDAMVQYSRSRAERYAIEFDLELAWRRLLMLIGAENEQDILTHVVTK